jgi:hypothetical protein
MRGPGVGLWPPPARPERGTRCIPLTRTAGGCGGGGWVEQTEFSVEGAREVVNKERADSLLKPLLAAGAAFTMVRRLQGGQPLRPAGWRRSASPLAAVAVQTVERFRGGAWGGVGLAGEAEHQELRRGLCGGGGGGAGQQRAHAAARGPQRHHRRSPGAPLCFQPRRRGEQLMWLTHKRRQCSERCRHLQQSGGFAVVTRYDATRTSHRPSVHAN